jgi:hypothetical protein
MSDREAFTRCLTEKLLTYALGRGLERYDQPVVRTIAARVAANDYRFSRLVLEIVNSPPFQMRRGVEQKRIVNSSARKRERSESAKAKGNG